MVKWNVSTLTTLGGSKNKCTDSSVYAIAINGSDVYVGGQFTTAGGLAARNIAKWDGTFSPWSALGTGIDNSCCGIYVNALAFSSASVSLFAGGIFTGAGSFVANNIAQWNGSTGWSPLDTNGTNSTVKAIA